MALTAVLTAGGSAPGHDGIPYELYHPGARFVAHLLTQAFYGLEEGGGDPSHVLGDNDDLVVWIPKTPGADRAGHMRPLQLPTCLRRLFGSMWAARVGPIFEKRLTPHQTALRGGSCGPNISRVTSHLHAPRGHAPARMDYPMWRTLLGPLAAPARTLCNAFSPAPPLLGPAVWLADQSWAFERVGHAWLWAAARAHSPPPWVMEGLLHLAFDRMVSPPA